ncbi:MAG: hypothetical protein Q4G38_02590 [Aeriscardovia aeriphila]|nr:hypothetical protein [Aeriscardovia aeriphila]
MDELDEKLFALLDGVWPKWKEEETRKFYDYSEAELTTLYAFYA